MTTVMIRGREERNDMVIVDGDETKGRMRLK